MNRLGLFALPLGAFAFVAIFLFVGLFSDPRERDSALIERPMPPLALPDVMAPERIVTNSAFNGEVTLLNVWGTWCVTCAIELPFLTELRGQGVRIVGLYFEQNLDPDFGGKTLAEIQTDITSTLSRLGNPYEMNIFDQRRDYSLELGVTGAPETFVIDQQGIIRLHHIGELNQRVWQQKVKPVYDSLKANAATPLGTGTEVAS